MAQLEINPNTALEIRNKLAFLYGSERSPQIYSKLAQIMSEFHARNPNMQRPGPGLDQTDVILITYGDQIQELGRPALLSLAEFLSDRVKEILTWIHILPFYPYSSDDGFSVIDYVQVDPALGTWRDISRIGEKFKLMVDAVINHISAQSEWFRGFVKGEQRFENYFILVDPETDLSCVTRPRALPLLTTIRTVSGEKAVWTTFSDDQIDLNYANPEVLFEIVKVLLFYVERGALLIRLDAIAYLWKEIGSSCIHLEQTHKVIQLFRSILDIVAPGVMLITETNVPHLDNVTYFGDGTNEAQLVYQFPLAPLLVNAIQTGRATHLSDWADQLELPSDHVTFFNFTASHDGIGVMPALGVLSESEIQSLVELTLSHGGRVSYKRNPDGSQSVYELNISYFDALSNPTSTESLAIQVSRFMLSQTIMLALVGVPGIYVHSLLGSQSWREGVELTGRNRSINREKFQRSHLEAELDTYGSVRYQVFTAYSHLIKQRKAHSAFHPHGRQQVLHGNPALFVLVRHSPDGREIVLCIHNVSGDRQLFRVENLDFAGPMVDLLTGQVFNQGIDSIPVKPYQSLWLVAKDQ
ncbi:MAG: sugar phosphorylase [Anaerolineales bacterium]|nr:sugar phosphorylase [Anaerolineales bacterium]